MAIRVRKQTGKNSLGNQGGNMVRYAILGLLRSGAVRHGYGLLKEYRELSGCQLSVGNIYRELQRLLGDGLIETTENPPGADPRRTPYRITSAGIDAFDIWLGNPRRGVVADYHDEMTLRACLVVQMENSPVSQVLDQWREELAMRRSAFERESRTTARSTTSGMKPRFNLFGLLAGRRLKHLSVDVEFIEELRSAYRVSAGSSPLPHPRARSATHGRRREAR